MTLVPLSASRPSAALSLDAEVARATSLRRMSVGWVLLLSRQGLLGSTTSPSSSACIEAKREAGSASD